MIFHPKIKIFLFNPCVKHPIILLSPQSHFAIFIFLFQLFMTYFYATTTLSISHKCLHHHFSYISFLFNRRFTFFSPLKTFHPLNLDSFSFWLDTELNLFHTCLTTPRLFFKKKRKLYQFSFSQEIISPINNFLSYYH